MILIWIYHYLLNGIGLNLDLGNSFWIRKTLNFWYLNNISFSHHTISDLGKLDCIWAIPLDIINYTKEWRNILEVLLVYVTMKCDTQSCTKKHSNVDEDIIMHKLPKDGAVKTA